MGDYRNLLFSSINAVDPDNSQLVIFYQQDMQDRILGVSKMYINSSGAFFSSDRCWNNINCSIPKSIFAINLGDDIRLCRILYNELKVQSCIFSGSEGSAQ